MSWETTTPIASRNIGGLAGDGGTWETGSQSPRDRPADPLTGLAEQRQQAASGWLALPGESAAVDSTTDGGEAALPALFRLAQLDVQTATPATRVSPQQSDVDAAVARIRELMQDGGIFEDDLTNSELHQITRILDGLDAASTRQVIERLSDQELGKIVGEMKSWGAGHFNGLSGEEREAFLTNLAGKLDAAQFERVARTYGEPQEVADIVAARGSREAKVGFVRAYADRVSNAPQPGDWYENIGGATIRHGNEEARAVGNVLASMADDQRGLREALSALKPEQLDAVIGASMEMTSRQASTAHGTTVPVYSFNDTRINAILDAVATSDDPALKARVFSSAAKALAQVQGVDGILTPSVNAGRTATSIAEHMAGLLRRDTRGIVAELERTDPTGRAITPWTRQMLAAGKTEDLNAVLSELRSGPNGDPVAYLANPEVAEDLGYMIGGIRAGLHSLQASARDEAALVSKLLGFGYGRIPQVGSLVSFASEQVVNQVLGQVERGTLEAPEAFYILMVEGLPATTQRDIDAAAGRVIDWRTGGR